MVKDEVPLGFKELQEAYGVMFIPLPRNLSRQVECQFPNLCLYDVSL